MAANTIFRGDYDEFTMAVPLTIWTAGGTFFFAMKPKSLIDANDPTDANAVFKKQYNDTSITATTATDKIYTLTIDHNDTKDITPGKYIAEFQFVNTNGQPKTFKQFKYTILGDINQRVS